MSPLLLSLLLACSGDEPKPIEEGDHGKPPVAADPSAGQGEPSATAGEAVAEAPPAEAGAPVPTGDAPPPVDGAVAGENPTPTPVSTPPGGRPNPMGFGAPVTDPVRVSGAVAYSGGTKGKLRVDVMRHEGDGIPPTLLATTNLSKPGDWSFDVPRNAGKLFVVAFLDTNDNGPEPTEPQSKPVGIDVGDKAVTGVNLTLADGSDEANTKGSATYIGG